jgi:hypothetical protein
VSAVWFLQAKSWISKKLQTKLNGMFLVFFDFLMKIGLFILFCFYV